jgi:hypothetical protein
MDLFTILDLTKYFHPFKIYGPVHIHYDIHPETKLYDEHPNRIKMGFVSLLCNPNEIYSITKFPWFVRFEKEIPED